MAVAAASIVNIIGDLILSPIWGIQGAAVATAMATTTSCAILVSKVRKATAEWKKKQEIQETKEKVLQQTNINGDDGDSSNVASTTAATADDDNNYVPFFSLPDKKSMLELFKLAGPIFFVMMGKIACYSVLTVRATGFGVVPLAAHTLMMRVFFFFACFGDSLSQSSQCFYPQVAKNLRAKLFQRLFWLSAAVGLCNNQLSKLILNNFGRFLTKDPSVIGMMAQYSPFVGFALLLHPFIMLLEGTVLAKRDLIFMVGMYILTGLLHFTNVFSPFSSTFHGLWRSLFIFQCIRFVQFAVRVWEQSRREKVNDEKVGDVAVLPSS
jgi:Na+-driven multidrug efflux pump